MNPLDALEALEREATPGPFVATKGLAILNMDGCTIAPSVYAGVRHDKPYKPEDLRHCFTNARILATSRNILPEVIALARTVGDNIREDDLNGTYYLGEDTREALDALLRAISVDVEK